VLVVARHFDKLEKSTGKRKGYRRWRLFNQVAGSEIKRVLFAAPVIGRSRENRRRPSIKSNSRSSFELIVWDAVKNVRPTPHENKEGVKTIQKKDRQSSLAILNSPRSTPSPTHPAQITYLLSSPVCILSCSNSAASLPLGKPFRASAWQRPYKTSSPHAFQLRHVHIMKSVRSCMISDEDSLPHLVGDQRRHTFNQEVFTIVGSQKAAV